MFLPKEYELPTSSNGYMKFEQGQNKFRILSDSALLGYVGWFKDAEGNAKPKRYKTRDGFGTMSPDEYEEANIRHFWAFVVWNYGQEQLQILEVTQRGIMEMLEQYSRDDSWGLPSGYDITVGRKGEKLNTKYTVTAAPPSEVSKEIKDAFEKANIKLDALYSTKENPYGGNPFESTEANSEVDPDDLPF